MNTSPENNPDYILYNFDYQSESDNEIKRLGEGAVASETMSNGDKISNITVAAERHIPNCTKLENYWDCSNSNSSRS